MNYEKVYNQIIERGRGRILEGYKEVHHVIPKCMGGDDSEGNLVALTAREHFIVHWLLVRIYPSNRGLPRAALMMSTTRKGVKVSSRTYQELRENLSHSEETKLKMSIAKKGKPGREHTKESKLKISIAMKGKPGHWKGKKKEPHSEETKRKMKEVQSQRMKPHKSIYDPSVNALYEEWINSTV